MDILLCVSIFYRETLEPHGIGNAPVKARSALTGAFLQIFFYGGRANYYYVIAGICLGLSPNRRPIGLFRDSLACFFRVFSVVRGCIFCSRRHHLSYIDGQQKTRLERRVFYLDGKIRVT